MNETGCLMVLGFVIGLIIGRRTAKLKCPDAVVVIVEHEVQRYGAEEHLN